MCNGNVTEWSPIYNNLMGNKHFDERGIKTHNFQKQKKNKHKAKSLSYREMFKELLRLKQKLFILVWQQSLRDIVK